MSFVVTYGPPEIEHTITPQVEGHGARLNHAPEWPDAEPPLVVSKKVLQQAHGRVQLRVRVHGAAILAVSVPIHLRARRHKQNNGV